MKDDYLINSLPINANFNQVSKFFVKASLQLDFLSFNICLLELLSWVGLGILYCNNSRSIHRKERKGVKDMGAGAVGAVRMAAHLP